MQQIIVYAQLVTPRVEYIFSTLLTALGIEDFQLTDDHTEYRQTLAARINYSSEPIAEGEFWIKPAQLLFEDDIKVQEINCFSWKGTKAFYKTDGGDLPLDIFAAAFYLISRYEEYLPHKLDMYGRYAHDNSIAFKEGFLNLPLINIWLKEFQMELQSRFPLLSFKPSKFSFVPTYDIDIAWSYKEKGFLRNFGGIAKSLTKADFAAIGERLAVLQNRRSDPFDSYKYLEELHTAYELNPIYFFLVAGKNKGYDKNILPTSKPLQQLIKHHSDKFEIGIHPSWQSGDEDELLEEEINFIEQLARRKIYKSRQHYIRMRLPGTYRKLISNGILEDYSMGYGSINGFRASYCLPYKWYDLEREQATELIIYPFCFMDANSYYEQHYTPEQALQEFEHYLTVTKGLTGLLISIWHNHFLGTDKMFKGWKEAYTLMLAKATQ